MALLISILFSLYVSVIWVDYFRKVDLFEKEKSHHLILTFIAGAIFPFLIDVLHKYVLSPEVKLNGEMINDFAYSVLVIGLPEEIIKFLPLLIILIFFRRILNEPVDYLLYASVSALGFAFHENLLYIDNYGLEVIGSRSVLSVPSHVFDSALFAYGFVLYRFKGGSAKYLHVLLFNGLAVLSHGFYDFWLLNDTVPGGSFITIFYYFIVMSMFATVIGNCLNNSPFYQHKFIINPEKLIRRLFLHYAILFGALLIALGILYGMEDAGVFYLKFVVLRFLILAILIIRLSRFKIIPERWNKVKPELPFTLQFSSANNSLLPDIHQPRTFFISSMVKIRVKGDSFNESHINAFMNETFELHPVNPKKSFLQKQRKAQMEKKVFLRNDEVFYLIHIYIDGVTAPKTFLLKAKTTGQTMFSNAFPIAALVKIANLGPAASNYSELKPEDMKFLEWVVLKPMTKI